MVLSRLLRLRFTAGVAVFTLTACAVSNGIPDHNVSGSGSVLSMVLANRVDRWAVDVYVDKHWAGIVGPQDGGAAAVCCFPGVTNWNHPVTVTWYWGILKNPKTKAVVASKEKRSVQVSFPASGPHQDPDWHKADAYLCVILRDDNTVALAFSPTRSECVSK
ncbi:hypothetical protein [Burkholderia gladioli]|uniref:hypothetical protein n=1 Tax=Burkholderia gladioli TaxID=28095 RepID=UPI0016405A7E|nr:hypothetical protein [Burkholderia gladioli]